MTSQDNDNELLTNVNIPYSDEYLKEKEDSNIDGIVYLCQTGKSLIIDKDKQEENLMLEENGFLLKFLRLIKPFWKSKKVVRKWGIALIILTILQIALSVITVQWSALLFNALEAHSMVALFKEIGILVVIFLTSMGVTATHMRVKRNLQMYLRIFLTDTVIGKWMNGNNHQEIALNMTDDNSNPDGRIADDIRKVADEFIAMLHTLFLSTLTVITFTQMLWVLSGVLTLSLGFATINVYGYLVWIAVIYTALASIFGWRVSKPLTDTTNDLNTAEADFRFGLAEARENTGKVAMNHKEEEEVSKFKELLNNITKLYNTQTNAWSNIVCFSTGYGVTNMAFPILIAAPRYIMEKITLGGLMQSVAAFQQLSGALSWPVNNMAGIAQWRASVERVLGLVESLDEIEEKK